MDANKTTVSKAVADFLRHLQERNASFHTVKAYSRDLTNFAAYSGPRGWKEIDHIAIRGFLSQLYETGLSKTSVARSLAAVRSLYRWLGREGVVEQNPAKLVATPKLPKKLPRVPTIEEMNAVLDVTLTVSAASTTINDPRIGGGSAIQLMPLSANAAAEIGNGTIWFAAPGSQSVVINHANNAQADRTFRMAIIG